MNTFKLALAAIILQTGTSFPLNAQEAPNQIFSNGKIITVDDYFSIQEAVAISGDRILAVGSNAEINALAGPQTNIINLEGRTVIPGLIDNHNHVVRATEYWPNDARLDGVTSRAEALNILKAKASTLPAGEWLMSLGGWQESQFADSKDDFTLAELDALASDRPVFLQSVYHHIYGNTTWFEAMGIPITIAPGSSETASDLSEHVVRDENGKVTGRLNGGFPMITKAITHFPSVSADKQAQGTRAAFSYLSSIGLTSVFDPGGVGIKQESYTRLGELAESEGISVRIFHTLNANVPATPEAADALVERIQTTLPFQGNEMFDLLSMGEIYYGPFHWDGVIDPATPTPEDIEQGRKILTAAAANAWPTQTHAMQPETMDILLDVMTEINTEYPLRQLRWSVTHADNVGISQIERARHLGMNLQMRSISVLGNRGPLFEKFGEAAYDMPPLRLVQDSGIPFGLGTDGTKANQIAPFVTLWWAVTGRALGGEVVMKQTLTREEALIAHTRSNAYLMFQESNLGSIKPGLLADMVILDRDYLTVPEDEIKDIKAIATMVGGNIVNGSL
ncbi:MAG: amidohydrolase family protein [Proteobacteria bacterium]|jgi:predicted amidohydrolase YtcJ|nr:amidohydrolase family protein [Pseudomonadota bacterium]